MCPRASWIPIRRNSRARSLPPSRRRLLVLLWAILSLLLLIRLFVAGVQQGNMPPQSIVHPVQVNLNRGSIAQLMTLPGIGRSRAQAIVLHRVRHGPFASVNDLAEVSGIGPETVAALAAFVQV